MVKTLIICVDRDNDLGEKAGVKGPIIGEKACIEAGKKLLLKDPEDTDANSVFGAVRLKKETKNSEVVVLTGDKNVGIKSDEEIRRQLLKVMKKLKPKEAILVSDGVEDEMVLPIIQSYLPIISIKRVIMKQSEKLEGAYYMIKNFIKDLEKDPKMSIAFVGLPALALMLLAIFGATGWRIIIGAIGLYLLVKGFHFDQYIHRIFAEFSLALQRGWVGFSLYTIGSIFSLVGLGYGYKVLIDMGLTDYFQSSLVFLNNSIWFLFVGGTFFAAGKIFTSIKRKVHYLPLFALIFAVALITYSSTDFLLNPDSGMAELAASIIVGFAALIAAKIVEFLYK